MWAVRCLLIAVLLLSGCRERLIHNLSEAEANRILMRLHEVGIKADKGRQADGRWSLSVPAPQAVSALKHLEDSRLLGRAPVAVKEQRGALLSSEERRYQQERALSGNLEETLLSVPGVLEARVHLNLPPRDALLGRPLGDFESSGAVLALVSDDFAAEPAELARLVASAAGLRSEQVSVLLSRLESTAVAARLPVKKSQVDSARYKGWLLLIPWQELGLALSLIFLGLGWWLARQRRLKREFLARAQSLQSPLEV